MNIIAQINQQNNKSFYNILDQQSFSIILGSGMYKQQQSNSFFSWWTRDSITDIEEEINKFSSYSINEKISMQIQNKLDKGENVTLTYDYASISSSIKWNGDSSLTIKSKHNITIANNVTITNLGKGTLKLMAGIESEDDTATINFIGNAQVDMTKGGKVEVYYNPTQGAKDHKYHNTKSFYNYIKGNNIEIKALVNNIQDLQDIYYFPAGYYALSKNIDGSSFKSFYPISDIELPFTGDFDGNNFVIANLTINGTDNISIFGVTIGSPTDLVQIKNLKLYNITVKGSDYVGIIASESIYTSFSNIVFSTSYIQANTIVGGVSGSARHCQLLDIIGTNDIKINASVPAGKLFGGLESSKGHNIDCSVEKLDCVGLSIHNSFEEGDNA